MIGGLISLAYYGAGSGGEIGNLLFRLDQAGVFAYLLPFLLIFALLYGILSRVSILGDNQGINVVISLTVSLMALQFNFVSTFFSDIFPRLGVGLSVLLVVVILLGAFVDFNDDRNKWLKRFMVAIGVVLALWAIFASFGNSFFIGGIGFSGVGYFFSRFGGGIVLAIVTIALIAFVVKSSSPRNRERE